MKKRNLMVVGLVLALSTLMASSAFARWGSGAQGAYDCNGSADCYRSGDRFDSDVNVEDVTKYRKETLQLRDELLAAEIVRWYEERSGFKFEDLDPSDKSKIIPINTRLRPSARRAF